MIFNTFPQLLTAALDGYGLAYEPEDIVQPYIDNGRLIAVLEDWSPVVPGFICIIQVENILYLLFN